MNRKMRQAHSFLPQSALGRRKKVAPLNEQLLQKSRCLFMRIIEFETRHPSPELFSVSFKIIVINPPVLPITNALGKPY